jgi:hypothetical protein
MPFRGIADLDERGILTTALREYCEENRIKTDSFEYEAARQLLILLYEKSGHRNVADLKRALIVAIRREQ